MEIVQYPHPTLRYRSKPIKRVDRELKTIVSEMFDAMYAAQGIGLAANQVDLPVQLFVINLAGRPDEGEELVFINPVVSSPKGSSEAEEGCLSIVGVNGLVNRPAQVQIQAYNLAGEEINQTVDGLLARAIQHERDHLDGVLFIDRMSESARNLIAGELQDFELAFNHQRTTGELPSDEEIFQRLTEIEGRYC